MNTLNLSRYIGTLCILLFSQSPIYSWGFFGHKLINQQAVYSLPWSLQQFFLPHIDYLSRHAVDPDKRRYALKEEAFQHYFDTEMWSPYLNSKENANRIDLLWSLPSLQLIDNNSDTTFVLREEPQYGLLFDSLSLFNTSSEWDCALGTVRDTMAHHGILPITLRKWYGKLVKSFEKRDLDAVLKIAADLGHYIGDAHVPLHTTVNYNGQLTNQVGIHALWETHIPEWMANNRFDFVVGQAKYQSNILDYSWGIIRSSHELVDDVLFIEKDLRSQWPDDMEICPRQRTNAIAQLPCPEFLEEYHQRMHNMVEMQMRKSILAIASFWWSAYVDAGQPSLDVLNIVQKDTSISKLKFNKAGVRCD